MEIQLTQGRVAVVDDEDYERLAQFSWHYDSRGYARRNIREGGRHWLVRMHQDVLRVHKGVEVDHKNLNKLDNRKENLRAATRGQNQKNGGLRADSTSGFKGVNLYKRTGRWKAEIRVDGVRHHLGYFDSAAEAAHAYDVAARKYHGEFAKTNFEVAP